MKKNVLLSLFLFLACQTSRLSAQIDTSFWFAAPWVTPDHWWKDNVKLHISTFGAPSTTVHLRQPAAIAPNKYDTTFVIPANSTFDYTFWRDKLASATNLGFDSLETRPADQVVPYGLYLSSSANITVVYDIITRPVSFLNPETFSLKGRNALGTNFLCPLQTKWKNQTLVSDLNGDLSTTQPKQQINIVATQSNTVVWITPKCNVVGHAASISYSVLLTNPGSAYTIENATQTTTVSGQNLSGTAITSDKPIAVTVADDSVRSLTGCYDLMGDQIVSVNQIGKDYIVIKGAMYTTEPEGAFIVAKDNTTQLSINDGVSTTNTVINTGDTYHYITTQSLTTIHADKDIYVLHVTGFGCEFGAALLPPLNCSGSGLVSFSRNTPQRFALNILCRNGAQGTFTLNGSTTLVPATAFTMAPGTATLPGGPYYGAQISLFSTTVLPVGSYTIGNNTDAFALGVFDGDFGSGGLYHYMTSFMNVVDVKTNTLSPLCLNSTNTIALTGTVSGVDNTGVWTSANGTGTFAPYSSTLNTIACTYSLSVADTLLTSMKFYLNSTGSCRPIKDSVVIFLSHQPHITVSGNMSVCKNNLSAISLTAGVTNAASGSWSGGNGGVFSSPGLNTTYSLSQSDTTLSSLVFTITSQSPMPGCSNVSKTVTLTLLKPASVNAGTNIVVCGKTVPGISLSGSVTGISNTGIWSTSGSGSFLPSPTALTNNYLFSSSDLLSTLIVFTLTSTNNGLCLSVNDVLSVQRDTASVSILSNSTSICSGATVTMTAHGTPNYLWSTGATGSVIAVSPLTNQTYSVMGTSSLNCNSSASVNVTVYPLPTVTAVSDHSLICLGEYANLNASGANTYYWINIPATTNSVTVSPGISTSYTLVGTSIYGCTDTTRIEVNVDLCSGFKLTNPDTQGFSVYPNPNKGEFVVRSENTIELSLLNELGQLIRHIELSSVNGFKVSFSDLAAGIYILQAQVNGRRVNQKISVTKD